MGLSFTDYPYFFLFISCLAVITTVYLIRWLLGPGGRVNGLSNRYILITGCDTGFGRDTAIRFDELGFHVFATCLTKEGRSELRSSCSERLVALQMDVTDSNQIQQVYSKVCSLLPGGHGLWGLINNAGIFISGPVDWQPLNIFKRTADVNLWGLIDVTKTFLPLVKKAKGRIVNMASVGGRISSDYACAYCLTKHGVEAFSDALRREMKVWGVQVVIIEPGGFKTAILSVDNMKGMWRRQWQELSTEKQEEYGDEYLENALEAFCNNLTLASSDTSKVVDALEHAVTSHRPRERYLVGADAYLLAAVAMLPTRLADVVCAALLRAPLPRQLAQEQQQ